MKFAIVGVGAIGGTYLAFLSKAGHEVVGIVKKGREIDCIKVEGIWGSFETPVMTTSTPQNIDFAPDIIIISVKAYDTEKALDIAEEIMGDNTFLMIAQNGYYNYEKAVERFGKGRVILSRIIFGAEVVSTGHIRITVNADDVVIGDPSGVIKEEFLGDLADLFTTAGIPTRHERDVYRYLWGKVIYNCALNPLGALLETNYGSLVDNPFTRTLIDRIIDEIFEVQNVAGIDSFWSSGDQYKDVFYNKLVPPTRDHFPSMLRDIKKGRTEIDALNGAICDLGRKFGVNTPVNETVTLMVKAKELIAHGGG